MYLKARYMKPRAWVMPVLGFSSSFSAPRTSDVDALAAALSSSLSALQGCAARVEASRVATASIVAVVSTAGGVVHPRSLKPSSTGELQPTISLVLDML